MKFLYDYGPSFSIFKALIHSDETTSVGKLCQLKASFFLRLNFINIVNITYRKSNSVGTRETARHRLQGDVVYLGRPIAPLVYEPKWGGRGWVAGSHPMRTAVHITWHGAQKNFGDLTPYLTYMRYGYRIYWHDLRRDLSSGWRTEYNATKADSSWQLSSYAREANTACYLQLPPQ